MLCVTVADPTVMLSRILVASPVHKPYVVSGTGHDGWRHRTDFCHDLWEVEMRPFEMQPFVHNENIVLYEKLIAESERDPSRDEKRHAMLLKLLAEEKAKDKNLLIS